MNSSCVIRRLVRVVRWDSVRGNSFFSLIKPFLDVDERLGVRREFLEGSLKARGLKVRLSEVESCWTEYKDMVARMNQLDESRNELSKKITESMGPGGDVDGTVKDNLEHLRVSAKLLRQDFKNLKSAVHKYENMVFPMIFDLPNDLHPSVGLEGSIMFQTEEALKNSNSEHHLTIGKEQDIIDFVSPTSYFLKNDAALFELEAGSRIKSLLEKSFNMISGPGFSRTLVIEGCQGSKDPFLFPLEKSPDDVDSLYLNGAASVYPFLSFLTKTTRPMSDLPWRYFTLGRHYNQLTQTEDLFSANQTDAVHLFIGCSRESVESEFEDALNSVKGVYSSFGVPFRIVNTSAADLYKAESRRVSFQVFSSSTGQFFEIGYLSLYGDYLSKRINAKYSDNSHFLNILSGTIIKITPFLACYLEHAGNCKLL